MLNDSLELNQIKDVLSNPRVTVNTTNKVVMIEPNGYEYTFIQHDQYVTMNISYNGNDILNEMFSDFASVLNWLVQSQQEHDE